jgi:uncharacterized Zn-finger protein
MDSMTSPNYRAIKRRYHVTPEQLPLHCPTDEVALWSAHPRVYLPIEAPESKGKAICPYCGTEYFLSHNEQA